MLSGLWNKLRGMLGRSGSEDSGLESAGLSGARLRDLIEEVVEESDPRIRAMGNYQRALAPSVKKAFARFTELVGQIPAAIPIDNQAWATDPLVHALFSGVNDLQRVFSKSPDLRRFFDQSPDDSVDHCFLQVGMAMKEKTVLGMKLQGDQVRKDVRQISVSFFDYRILLPSETEEELREALALRGFRLLVSYAVEQIAGRQNQIAVLEQQRHMLNARLRTAKARAAGLEGLLTDEGEKSEEVEALERKLVENQQALEDAKTGFTTLEDYVRCISDVLGQPEAHVRITPRTLFLNRMNVKLEDGTADGAREIRITEVSLGEEFKRTVVLARFPRDLLLEKGHFLREAERYYS